VRRVGIYAEPGTACSKLERVPRGDPWRTIGPMRWTDPDAVRVLVLVEPELFRSAIVRVLEGVAGIEVTFDEPAGLVGAHLTRIVHPSSGIDVVLASPALARRLAMTGVSVIEVPDAAEPAITLHRAGRRAVRRAATLRSLVQLIEELAAPEELAAEAR